MPEDTGNVEERARRMGWLPEEEFRGNPDNWVPPDKFVEMAETSMPHLKGTLSVMEKRMAEQEKTMQGQTAIIQAMKEDMAEFVEFSRGAEKRAYEQAIKDLQERQRDAVEAGDLPAFDKVTAELDQKIAEHPALTGKKKAIEASKTQPMDEYKAWLEAEPTVFDSWKDANPWFSENPDMFAYAMQMDAFLQQKDGFTVSRSKRLERITDLVKKKFPDHFGNTARRAGSPVEGDTGGVASKDGRRSYNDLPEEAKKQCDKWCGKDGKGESGSIPGLTREQYIQQYRW